MVMKKFDEDDCQEENLKILYVLAFTSCDIVT
jgi:hypothetical protein